MGLAKQGDFSETLIWGKKKKKDLTTFGRRGKQLKKNTRILLGYVERKLKKNPKPQLELNLTKIVERFTHALEAERLR